jgi:hypothetical protein
MAIAKLDSPEHADSNIEKVHPHTVRSDLFPGCGWASGSSNVSRVLVPSINRGRADRGDVLCRTSADGCNARKSTSLNVNRR